MKRDEQSRNDMKVQELQLQAGVGLLMYGLPGWRQGSRTSCASMSGGQGCGAQSKTQPRPQQPAACKTGQARALKPVLPSGWFRSYVLVQLGSHFVTADLLNDTREREQQLAATLAAKQEQLATSRRGSASSPAGGLRTQQAQCSHPTCRACSAASLCSPHAGLAALPQPLQPACPAAGSAMPASLTSCRLR